MSKYFITGIGTEVGKTVTSAIITEALKADYWKPIQAGDLDFSDTHKVKELISNPHSFFHPNSFALNEPMSPHAAAEIDGVDVSVEKVREPETRRDLVIEGAGGILVPINGKETILDLIKPDYKVIVVSRYYLGSINHTLLTVEALRRRQLDVAGIIFSGTKIESSREIIREMTDLPVLLEIDHEEHFTKKVVRDYAKLFLRNTTT